MGLFSGKKEDKAQASTKTEENSPINIPLPPGRNSRFRDDFDRPFDIDTPIGEQVHESQGSQSRTILIPTALTPVKVDLDLPTFSTESTHDLDLDAMERELSGKVTKEEKDSPAEKQETAVQKTEDAPIKEEEDLEAAKIPEIKESIEEKHDESFDLDEIPDEIEDIPDFIPELDVDEQMLSDTTEYIEEPKNKRSAFIGLNSIIEVKKHSAEIKSMIDSISEGTTAIDENDKKQDELMTKSKATFEDIERKILFINKVLFQEG